MLKISLLKISVKKVILIKESLKVIGIYIRSITLPETFLRKVDK